METFLNELLTTLNLIEVKGKRNMDYLLGAILAVENAIEQLTPKEAEEDNG